jgi:hypothetical protein
MRFYTSSTNFSVELIFMLKTCISCPQRRRGNSASAHQIKPVGNLFKKENGNLFPIWIAFSLDRAGIIRVRRFHRFFIL